MIFLKRNEPFAPCIGQHMCPYRETYYNEEMHVQFIIHVTSEIIKCAVLREKNKTIVSF